MCAVVIALMGLPGSGKSRLARCLCQRMSLRLVNRDDIRQARFPGGGFSDEEKQAANDSVLRAVTANCRLGASSIVDGWAFSRRSDLETLRRCVQQAGGRLLPLLLDCPVELAKSRVAADAAAAAHPARDRDAALVGAVASRFEAPPEDAVRLDAGEAHDVVCRIAEQAIRNFVHSAAGGDAPPPAV